jgi:dipeptidyl aminopeptidase/acylaminoacyl peptidase
MLPWSVYRPAVLTCSLYSFLSYESEVPLWIVPVLGGSPRRVGKMLVLDASWSADGQIVFTNEHDIYISRVDGTESRKLASAPGFPAWPRWSPRGDVLRYTNYDPSTDSSSLWEVSRDGTRIRPLLPGWSRHGVECCGNWTSDGRYFLFQSTHNGRTDIWAIREKQNWWQAASEEPVQLTALQQSF